MVNRWPELPHLSALHAAAFGGTPDDGHGWRGVLQRSLCWVTAHQAERLVGFVNIAWDGGQHAFLLDTAVQPDLQGQGLGTRLVQRAVTEAQARGAVWLHVDFEPQLEAFYRRCGFRFTTAGLMRLSPPG